MNRNTLLMVGVRLAVLLTLCGAMVASTPVFAQDPSATATVEATMQATDQAEQGEQRDTGDTADVIYLSLNEVTSAPDQYFGQRVSLEGYVHELVNVRTFVLSEGATLGNAQVVVVNNSGDLFPLELTADEWVQIAGTVQRFARADDATMDATPEMGVTPQATLDAMATLEVSDVTAGAAFTDSLDLPQTVLFDYADYTVIVLDSVTDINFLGDMNAITDNPERYYGRSFTMRGVVGDVVSPQAFVLREGTTLDDDSVLVINTANQEFQVATDHEVWVYGTVASFDRAALEQQYGVTLDENTFAEYADYPVLLAESASPR